MKYLVMECHPGYAVVLDEQGRFLRAANLNYQVGQTLTHIEQLHEVEDAGHAGRRRYLRILAAAACLCLVLFGGARLTLAPYGVVHMQINPEVEITVNRFDYVLQLSGVNPEGQALVQDYTSAWKKVDQVADDLTDRAMSMGYLNAGGEIHLAVESAQTGWQTATQNRLVQELSAHTQGAVQVIGEDMDHWLDWEDPVPTPPQEPQPTPTEDPQETSYHHHDPEDCDDDCCDDDEDDEDDKDDEEDDPEDDEDDEEDDPEDDEDDANDLEQEDRRRPEK